MPNLGLLRAGAWLRMSVVLIWAPDVISDGDHLLSLSAADPSPRSALPTVLVCGLVPVFSSTPCLTLITISVSPMWESSCSSLSSLWPDGSFPQQSLIPQKEIRDICHFIYFFILLLELPCHRDRDC